MKKGKQIFNLSSGESEPIKEIKRRATKYIKEYAPQELTAETQGVYAGVYKCDKFFIFANRLHIVKRFN